MKGSKSYIRFISKEIGFILFIESFLIFVSALISSYYREDCAKYIWLSGGITLVTSGLLSWYGHKIKLDHIEKRESILTVTLAWLLFSLFGTLPYFISGEIPDFTNAFFETTSGFTTTGSSILQNIESLPKGLLFWRSLTQWIGGLGMIVLVLAFLPLAGGSGSSHLYDEETTGITSTKFRPRIGQVAKRLWLIYLTFTFILMVLLLVSPMNAFDAFCHALTTMATGGYSTKQASIAYWNSAYIEYVITLFMLIGATNFTLWYFLFKGNFKKIFYDEELRWFLCIIAVVTGIITTGLFVSHQVDDVSTSFRHAFFQVVSIISTTGFATADFTFWGPVYWFIITLLMITCGCGGSTSGGMKTVRFVVLAKNTMNEFNKQIHPKAIIPVRINGNAISTDVVQRILAFAFLYIVIILISILVFTATGMEFEEAWGVSISGISNVGPGLESFGPSGNYSGMNTFAKWYYSFLMITGRLELFTVLILFTPGFWKGN